MRAGRRADCSCERTPALQAGRERGNHRTLCSIRKKPPRPGRADSMLRSAARRLLLGAHPVQHQEERSPHQALRFHVTWRPSPLEAARAADE